MGFALGFRLTIFPVAASDPLPWLAQLRSVLEPGADQCGGRSVPLLFPSGRWLWPRRHVVGA